MTFIIQANKIDNLISIFPTLYTEFLNETLKYLLQGINDTDVIMQSMREDGFWPLVKPCACVWDNPGCTSCYTTMHSAIDLENFIEMFKAGVTLNPDMIKAIAAKSVQGGAYGVELEIIDPNSLAIHVF
jgi:hypothetical protein